MAVTERAIPAPVDRVFELLADGCSYGEWVVGAKHIRDADDGWPAPGSKIHHTVGFGPIVLHDSTEVVELDAPRMLALEARVRPTGVARVVLRLAPTGDGTHVTMEEQPVSGPAKFIPRALVDPLIDWRNRRALGRLAAMAAGRQSTD